MKRRRPLPNWACDQLPYEKLLTDSFIGNPRACSLMSGLMATYRTAPETKCPLPRTLIAGATSSGKSYLVQLAADLLNAPTAYINGTALTGPGYKGLNLHEALRPLTVDRQFALGGRGILVIDEFDKVIEKAKRDEWARQVEYSLLPIFSGDIVQITDEESGETKQVSFKNVLVFAMGVFNGVRMNQWKSHQTSQVALERFGFTPEIVGRFSHFIGLQKPNIQSFEELISREYQALKNQYRMGDLEPYLEKARLRKIARESYKSPYGLRAARGLIHQQLFAEAYRMAPEAMI